jgi:cytochrome c peroxidase
MMTRYVKVLLILVGGFVSVQYCVQNQAEGTKPTPFVLEFDENELGNPTIPDSNPLTIEGVRLGRLLFYDPILSSNNEMSCGSCHLQSKAFTDGNRLAVGTYGDTLGRNTMSLLNLAWASEYFWDGRVTTLEQLVREPVTNPLEMAQDTLELVVELSSHQYYPTLFEKAFPNETVSMGTMSKAIAQFLRTIVSNGLNVDYDSFDSLDYSTEDISEAEIAQEASLRGSFIRFSEMCSPCHTGAVYGNVHLANNALVDTLFKAPTLLNIMHTGPYMHDGRFTQLSEVLEHYQNHLDSIPSLNYGIEMNRANLLTPFDLTHADEIFQLFEDTLILVNPAFSDPFTDEFIWQGVLSE